METRFLLEGALSMYLKNCEGELVDRVAGGVWVCGREDAK